MIEPSKATKGRRMSKKTRKKTLKKTAKAPAAKTARARSAGSSKIPAAKKRMSAAGKSARTAVKASKPVDKSAKTKTGSNPAAKTGAKTGAKPAAKTASVTAAVKASHPRPSKTLKLTPPAKSSESKTAEITALSNPTPELTAPPATGAALAQGMKAPAFRLPRDGGETVTSADFAGRKLVLFFYPRADTPGCTKEAIDFTRLAGAFADTQTAVLGVSADPLKAQEAFRDKHELKVPLISDEQHEMLEAYGAWGEKSMYGRTFLGVIRTTVLIGADGRIARIWRHVKVDGHADEVLAAAEAA
jgi:thioredoxin-dependent peroxiredoxin